MLFTVIARDSTAEGTPALRASVRPRHLEELARHVESGAVQYAGAMLDDEGTPHASILFLEAPDRAAVQALLDADPYTEAGVWASFEIHPFRRAV